jgi:DNA-binding XRE family transcriptional regulator
MEARDALSGLTAARTPPLPLAHISRCTFVNFSEKFRDLCETCGKNQKELAIFLGLSEGSIVNYRNGRTPKSDELLAIARYFGVSMEWLLAGENDVTDKGDSAWRHHVITAEQKLDSLKTGIVAFVKKF